MLELHRWRPPWKTSENFIEHSEIVSPFLLYLQFLGLKKAITSSRLPFIVSKRLELGLVCLRNDNHSVGLILLLEINDKISKSETWTERKRQHATWARGKRAYTIREKKSLHNILNNIKFEFSTSRPPHKNRHTITRRRQKVERDNNNCVETYIAVEFEVLWLFVFSAIPQLRLMIHMTFSSINIINYRYGSFGRIKVRRRRTTTFFSLENN